jgi:hypothetical protein
MSIFSPFFISFLFLLVKIKKSVYVSEEKRYEIDLKRIQAREVKKRGWGDCI